MGAESPLQQAINAHGQITAAMRKTGLLEESKQTRQILTALVADRHFGLPMVSPERHEGNSGMTPVYATRIGNMTMDLSLAAGPMTIAKGSNMRPTEAMEVLNPQRNPGLEAKYAKLLPHLPVTGRAKKADAQPA